MSPARTAFLLALLPLALPSLPAQQPAKSAPATGIGWTGQVVQSFDSDVPTIHTTSRLVVLDMVVTDGDGNPVKGLRPSAFALLEDGVPQKITAVTEFSPSAAPPIASDQSLAPNTFAVQAPPPDSVTKTIIVLDQLHYPNYPLVRADIYAFLKTAQPGNPTAIIRLDWQGLHLVQSFTSDPELIRQTVTSARMLPPPPSIDAATPHGSAYGPPACSIPYTGVTNPYRRLASYVAGIPGRINLAWITDEGDHGAVTTGENFPDLTTVIRDLSGTTDVLRVGRVVPYLIKAGGSVGGMLPPLEAPEIPVPVIIPISHADPVDPKCPLMPAAAGSIFANRDLSDIATAAGGHAFFDGPREALTRIAATNSDYYTVSYIPTNPNWNGKFRKIKINIAGLPDPPISLSTALLGWTETPGPKVFYRPGYYARSSPRPTGPDAFGTGIQPDSTLDPARKLISVSARGAPPTQPVSPFAAAMGFGVATPAAVQFTVQVSAAATTEAPQPGAALPKDNFFTASYRSQPYRNYRIHYWIDPQHLKFTRTAAGTFRDDLQFAAIIYGDDGLAINSISATAHIQESADDLETILASGITFDQTIAMPAAGNFYLRAGVLESSSGRLGALEVPTGQIKLPPAQTMAVSTPNQPKADR